MRTFIEFYLTFKCQVNDGTVVRGSCRMVSFVMGDLPRIGEQIMPATGHSDINIVFEYYEIRVVDICRRVGGDYISTYFCDVDIATKSVWGGRPLRIEKTSQQVTEEWKNLKVFCERTWNQANQEGIAIATLDFKE